MTACIKAKIKAMPSPSADQDHINTKVLSGQRQQVRHDKVKDDGKGDARSEAGMTKCNLLLTNS